MKFCFLDHITHACIAPPGPRVLHRMLNSAVHYVSPVHLTYTSHLMKPQPAPPLLGSHAR